MRSFRPFLWISEPDSGRVRTPPQGRAAGEHSCPHTPPLIPSLRHDKEGLSSSSLPSSWPLPTLDARMKPRTLSESGSLTELGPQCPRCVWYVLLQRSLWNPPGLGTCDRFLRRRSQGLGLELTLTEKAQAVPGGTGVSIRTWVVK